MMFTRESHADRKRVSLQAVADDCFVIPVQLIPCMPDTPASGQPSGGWDQLDEPSSAA